mgnify:CR=1 FL=1
MTTLRDRAEVAAGAVRETWAATQRAAVERAQTQAHIEAERFRRLVSETLEIDTDMVPEGVARATIQGIDLLVSNIPIGSYEVFAVRLCGACGEETHHLLRGLADVDQFARGGTSPVGHACSAIAEPEREQPSSPQDYLREADEAWPRVGQVDLHTLALMSIAHDLRRIADAAQKKKRGR